jgi:hypothetical protein
VRLTVACGRLPELDSTFERSIGDRVNIEVDQMARYAARLMEAGKDPAVNISRRHQAALQVATKDVGLDFSPIPLQLLTCM